MNQESYKYLTVTFLALLLLVSGLAGYLALQLQTTGSPASPPKEIAFGCALPLSGDLAVFGKQVLQAYQYWVDEMNEAGGLYLADYGVKVPLRLVYYDDKGDPETTAKLYERLCTDDGVDMVFGPWGSARSFAACPVIEKHKKPMVLAFMSSEDGYKLGYQFVFNFMVIVRYHGQYAFLNAILSLSPKPKTAAIVSPQELFPITSMQSAKKQLEANGVEVVLYQEYPKGTTDFSDVITQMKTLNPDILLSGGFPAEFTAMLIQMEEYGWRPKAMYNSDVARFQEWITEMGETGEGVCSNEESFDWNDAEYLSVKEGIMQKFDLTEAEYSPAYHATAWGACQVMKEAIEVAGSIDGDEVRRVLEAIYVDTIVYPYKVTDVEDLHNINTYASMGSTQIQNINGIWRAVRIYPFEVADGEPLYPLEPWS